MLREKKFLRKLNSKKNKNGEITISLVFDLLKYNDVYFENNIRTFGWKRKDPIQIISDNIGEIIKKINKKDIDFLANLIITRLDFDKVLSEYYELILEKFQFNNYKEMYKFDLFEIKSVKLWYKVFVDCDEKCEKKILEYIDKIVENDKENTFKIVQLLKGINKKIDEHLNKILLQNFDNVIEEIIRMSLEKMYNFDEDQKEEGIQYNKVVIEEMVKELLESENARPIDIEVLKKGAYSSVYKIGDKVIKIGTLRQTYQIPNSKIILKPLVRTILKDKEQKDFIFVEIADYVDINFKDEENMKEKLYEIYKELRQEGIIWTDAKIENVGVLKKDNIPNLNGETLYVEPNTISFCGDIGDKVLKKGDYVVIDTDFLYNQNDFNVIWPSEKSKEYEKRYQQELQKNITKKRINSVKKFFTQRNEEEK